MAQIVNIKHGPKCRYLYIGRKNKFYNQEESIFHNPFIIGEDGTREEVIQKFEEYALSNKELLDNLKLIDGYDFLGCYCDYPSEDCHGRVLIELREKQKKGTLILPGAETNKECKCIIAGSRHLNRYNYVVEAVRESGFKIDEVVSGAANGIDTLGELYAVNNKIKLKKFPAKWKDFTVKPCVIKVRWDGAKYNSWAGHIRNKEMAQYGTHLILIWDGKSSGSASMKKLAREHNLKIYEKII